MGHQRAKKRFGQHFLQDTNVIDRIITTFSPEKGQKIIEIGPGKGALTIPLLRQQIELDVIEIDKELAQSIINKCNKIGKINMHCVDVLRLDFGKFSNNKLRIIGNLPYNISTPILFHLLKFKHCITDMLFMLQKEVVDRLSAEPGNKNYGRLSVMVQSQCQVEKLFDIGPESFTPPPKVNSSLVQIRFCDNYDKNTVNSEAFARIVNSAFQQRRKTLRNSLKAYFDENEIKNAGIAPGARPEQLTIDQFVTLTDRYQSSKNQ